MNKIIIIAGGACLEQNKTSLVCTYSVKFIIDCDNSVGWLNIEERFLVACFVKGLTSQFV